METTPDVWSDPKLYIRPVVLLQRLDLLEHLDNLSEDCLSDLQTELRHDVLKTKGIGSFEAHSTVKAIGDDEDDDIQIIEVKTPKKDKPKVEIRRVKQEIQVRKLRKKALLSREIFKPTVKRITSTTAVTPGAPVKKSVPLNMEKSPVKKPKAEALNQISGVMDVVNEKLAVLKEREKKLMESIRTRKKKPVDPAVKEELEAMAYGDSELIQSVPLFNFIKPAAPRPEKTEKVKKEKAPEFSFADKTTLRALQQTSAKTTEEKYRVLEARDKLFQSKREKVSNREHRLVGTCPDMCPEKERLRRCFQSQVSPFEMVDYPRSTEVREEWMVKEYARSSADQDTPLPHELRPVAVLQRTMDHLCRNIADRCEFSDELLDDWYMFMWDRTRAIRKDLTHQDSCSPSAVRLLEQCARFHIHCAERLVDQDVSVYDDKINTENLTKCLQTLKYMYRDLRSVGITCDSCPEFLSYSLLLNLNNTAIMTEVRDMPEDVLSSEPLRFALEIISARETKNYMRFFKLVKRTTYLNCCILRRYFSEMRVHAFATMVRALCPQRLTSVAVPLLPLVENLMFEGLDDCAAHLRLCNLKVEEREGVPVIILDRKAFQPPEMAFPLQRSVLYIQEKKRSLLSEIMWGAPLGEPVLPPPLQKSFTSAGEFKIDSVSLDISEEPNGLEKGKGKKEVEVADIEEEEERSSCDEEGEYMEEIPEEDENLLQTEAVNPPFPAPTFSSKSIFSISPTAPFPGFASAPSTVPLDNKPSQGFSFGSVFASPPKADSVPLFGGKSSPKSTAATFSFLQTPKSCGGGWTLDSVPRGHEFSGKSEEKTPSPFPVKRSFILDLLPELNIPDLPVQTEPVHPYHLTFTPLQKNAPTNQIDTETAKKISEKQEMQKEEIALKKAKEAERLAVELEDQRKEERLVADKKRIELEEKKVREDLVEKKRLAAIEKKNLIKKRLETFGKKYRRWKVQVFVRLWRTRAWTAAEGRRMEKYLEALAISYPPVCGPELLGGNPVGEVIPNTLLVQKRPAKQPRHISPRSRASMSGPPPALPLVHMGRAVAPTLQARVQALYPDPLSPFRTCFPWKLVLCLPDQSETPVRLDTFLEMHFVERFDWKFGVESGPLAYCVHRIGSLELVISVRRVKGLKLLEGSAASPEAVQGANSLLFFLTDDARSLPVARQRLDKLRMLPGGTEVPVVAFVFGDRLFESAVRSSLGLDGTCHVVTCGGISQQSLVMTLSESLSLAADIAAPVPTTRSPTLPSLIRTGILDQIWRRAEKAFINFDVLLREPTPLIAYCNECLDNLLSVFLDRKRDEAAHLAPEFESLVSQLEAPLELWPAPLRDEAYCSRLKAFFNDLKLPTWPMGPVRSTQELNYRLHQYGKLVIGQDKDKMALKHLKWRVYRVIQKTLLWKGLDIYCDEDINVILLRFPWVQVLQEFLRSRVESALAASTGYITVVYDMTSVENFCYGPPLIDHLEGFTETSDIDVNLDETRPMPEKDSILLAYAKAVEREIEAEEARKNRKLSLSEEVAEVLNATMPLLTPRPETPQIETLETPEAGSLKRGLEELDDVIADLSSGLEKRRKVIEEMLADITDSRTEET